MAFFKIKEDTRARFTCPFCKTDIVNSHKTEIFYKNKWVKGCNNCFDLSIGLATNHDFQTKTYEDKVEA